MKTLFITVLVTAVAAIAAGFAIPRLGSVEVAAAPVPLVTTAPVEHYLVLDTSRVPVSNLQTAPATLEAVLNDLGARGWRVRTAMGSTIILAR